MRKTNKNRQSMTACSLLPRPAITYNDSRNCSQLKIIKCNHSDEQNKSLITKVTPNPFSKKYFQNPDFEAIYLFSVNTYHTSAVVKCIPWQSSFIMLKFQQNRMKPELIRILFVISLDKGRKRDSAEDLIIYSVSLNHKTNILAIEAQ